MAEAMRTSARATAPQLQGVVSAANGGNVNVQLTGLADSTGYLALGSTASDPPATYGDLSGDMGGAIVGFGLSPVITYDRGLSNTYGIRVDLPVSEIAVLAGRKLWVMWFEGSLSVPGPTDVPGLVSVGIDTVA